MQLRPGMYMNHRPFPVGKKLFSSRPMIYLVVGEHSGDAIGANLMKALEQNYKVPRFAGIGGPKMTSVGNKVGDSLVESPYIVL